MSVAEVGKSVADLGAGSDKTLSRTKCGLVATFTRAERSKLENFIGEKPTSDFPSLSGRLEGPKCIVYPRWIGHAMII